MRNASISVARGTPEDAGEYLLEGAKEPCGCAEDPHPAPDEALWLEGVGPFCGGSFLWHVSADEPSLAKVTVSALDIPVQRGRMRQ